MCMDMPISGDKPEPVRQIEECSKHVCLSFGDVTTDSCI